MRTKGAPSFVRRWLFLLCAVVVLIVSATGVVAGFQYDESGLRGLLFWIIQIVSVPFWAIDEATRPATGGVAWKIRWVVNAILLIIVATGLDVMVNRLRRRRHRA